MTHPPTQVLSASLEEIVEQSDARYNAITSLLASVEVLASTGGARQGQVTEYPSLSGYILLRKPEDLRVILFLPVVHSRAVDMATDGKTFQVYIPLRNKVITGSNELTTPSKNALENLRPSVFFDSMLIRGTNDGELISLTSDERTYQPDPKKKFLIAEPEYDLYLFRRKPNTRELQTHRVIHIGRATMRPFQQDIYDQTGQLVTQAIYDNYQAFGSIEFPSKITIRRPLDQLSLVVTITKLAVNNQQIKDTQFDLKVPAGTQIQKLP
jgi:outer membrane lipoprotein-sorting protein